MAHLLGLILSAFAVLASAAELPDPTRPPTAVRAAASVPEAPLVVTALYRLGTRPYALVDGMVVHVGDPLGDARVTRIDETGVWLKGSAGVRQLRLLPEVAKTVAKTVVQAQPKETTGKGRK